MYVCRHGPGRIVTYLGDVRDPHVPTINRHNDHSVYSHALAVVDQMLKPYYLNSLGIVVDGNLITLFRTCGRSLAQRLFALETKIGSRD